MRGKVLIIIWNNHIEIIFLRSCDKFWSPYLVLLYSLDHNENWFIEDIIERNLTASHYVALARNFYVDQADF